MPARRRARCICTQRSCRKPTTSSCICTARMTASVSRRRTSRACSKRASRPSLLKPTRVSACTGAPTRSAPSAGGSGPPATVPDAAHRSIYWCHSSVATTLRSQEPPEVAMKARNPPKPIRVLVGDDESEVRSAYRQILCGTEAHLEMTGFHELRSRLFRKDPAEALRQRAAAARLTSFDVTFCEQAPQAVAAVKDGLARNEPFALVFLDVRMPPGPDGVLAATKIRELDPAIEIVVCTAYSDA